MSGRVSSTGARRALWLLGALALLLPRAGFGHGGVSVENDQCKLRVGMWVMHFTGYQPESTAEREFCEDIPATGRTLIVLDYIDEALRDIPVEVRVIRDTGDESDLDKLTVFHRAATVYPKGTVSLEMNFPEPGRFVGLVVAGDQTSRFPFAVGTGGRRAMMSYALFGAGALGVGAILFFYSRSRAGA